MCILLTSVSQGSRSVDNAKFLKWTNLHGPELHAAARTQSSKDVRNLAASQWQFKETG